MMMARENIIYWQASEQGVSEITVVKYKAGCGVYTRIGAIRRYMPRPVTHFDAESVVREAAAWIADRTRCEQAGNPWANQYDGHVPHPGDVVDIYGKDVCKS
jgi:hypothetical protein